MTCPRVSIVTPSYNQGRYIEATMESVFNQDYPNLEYIVVDGSSNDQSVDIIRRHEKKLAFWVSEPDRGAADALSKGFRHATGEILAYLNSDDLYMPGALRAIVDAMKAESDVIYGDTQWIDADGRAISVRRQTAFDASGYLYGGADLQQPSVFWRRRIFDKAGGIDPAFRFAFDTDLFFRFIQHGARFQHIRRVLSSFRIHGASKSSNEMSICTEELGRLRQRHLRYGFHSPQARWLRLAARARRVLAYAAQGDLLWLLGRIPDRWQSRHSADIAGPKARWI